MKQTDNYVKGLNKALMNKALAYLSNFSSTENKLKTILNTFSENHFKEYEIIQVQKEIISIINKCKELGYINDEEFTKNKIEQYNNAGTSKKAIIFKLQNYGIDKIIVNNQLPGTYSIDWNASNYSSGLYMVLMKTKYFNISRKVLLIK